MSADRTDRSEDGGSQAERAITLFRGISDDCTKSRLHHTAWEVRVSVVPDFRLHPSSEIGSLYFVSWDQLNVSDPNSEEGWRRKSGATETLTSHAVWYNLDFVRRREILLHFVSARSAWLPPSSLLSVLSADIQFQLTQSTNGGSQGVRCKTYRS